MVFQNVLRLEQSVYKAVYTLFGNHKFGIDTAADIRYSLRNTILKEYKHFDIIQILFGKGYMYQTLDFPILQVIIDSGILFALLFIVCTFYIPMSYTPKTS